MPSAEILKNQEEAPGIANIETRSYEEARRFGVNKWLLTLPPKTYETWSRDGGVQLRIDSNTHVLLKGPVALESTDIQSKVERLQEDREHLAYGAKQSQDALSMMELRYNQSPRQQRGRWNSLLNSTKQAQEASAKALEDHEKRMWSLLFPEQVLLIQVTSKRGDNSSATPNPFSGKKAKGYKLKEYNSGTNDGKPPTKKTKRSRMSQLGQVFLYGGTAATIGSGVIPSAEATPPTPPAIVTPDTGPAIRTPIVLTKVPILQTKTPSPTPTATETPHAVDTATVTATKTPQSIDKHTLFLPLGGGGEQGLWMRNGTLLSIDANGRLRIMGIRDTFANKAIYESGQEESENISRYAIVEPAYLETENGAQILLRSEVHYDDRVDQPYKIVMKLKLKNGQILEKTVQPDIVGEDDFVKEAHEPRMMSMKLNDGSELVGILYAEGESGNIGFSYFRITANSLSERGYLPIKTGNTNTKRTPELFFDGPKTELSAHDGKKRMLTAIVPNQSGTIPDMFTIGINEATGKVTLESQAHPVNSSEASGITKIAYGGWMEDKGQVIAGVTTNASLGIFSFPSSGNSTLENVTTFSEMEIQTEINNEMNKKGIQGKNWKVNPPEVFGSSDNPAVRIRNNKFTTWIDGHMVNSIVPVFDEYGNTVMGFFKYNTQTGEKIITVLDTRDDIDPFYIPLPYPGIEQKVKELFNLP